MLSWCARDCLIFIPLKPLWSSNRFFVQSWALQQNSLFSMVPVLIRLPPGDVLRTKALDLLEMIYTTMFIENEDNCLLCLKIHQDLHRAYRPALDSKIHRFLEFAKQVSFFSKDFFIWHYCMSFLLPWKTNSMSNFVTRFMAISRHSCAIFDTIKWIYASEIPPLKIWSQLTYTKFAQIFRSSVINCVIYANFLFCFENVYLIIWLWIFTRQVYMCVGQTYTACFPSPGSTNPNQGDFRPGTRSFKVIIEVPMQGHSRSLPS